MAGARGIMIRTGRRARAFTLIELLVVIAIITVLGSLLLSAIGVVKDQAKRVACASNLRALGMATLAYLDAHDELLPQGGGYNDATTGNWWNCPQVAEVMAYLDVTASSNTATTRPLHCPANPTGLMYPYWPGVPADRPTSLSRLVASGRRNSLPGGQIAFWSDAAYLRDGGNGRGFANGCMHKGRATGTNAGIPKGGNVATSGGAVIWAGYAAGNAASDSVTLTGYTTYAVPTCAVWFSLDPSGNLEFDRFFIGGRSLTFSTAF